MRPKAVRTSPGRRTPTELGGSRPPSRVTAPALVAQGIEHRPPEACAGVRIAPRAQGRTARRSAPGRSASRLLPRGDRLGFVASGPWGDPRRLVGWAPSGYFLSA